METSYFIPPDTGFCPLRPTLTCAAGGAVTGVSSLLHFAALVFHALAALDVAMAPGFGSWYDKGELCLLMSSPTGACLPTDGRRGTEGERYAMARCVESADA